MDITQCEYHHKKTKILQKERKQASNLESIDIRATPSVCAQYVTLQIKVE